MKEFTSLEYLQIDLANNFGLDKRTWDQRIQWATEHEDVLETLIQEAEEPAMFQAALLAYRSAQKGEPIGYPISLDSTASGMQILSCLIRDRKAAALCNVIDAGTRQDAYTVLYDTINRKLGVGGSTLQRKDVKQAVMTAFYGSEATPEKVFGTEQLHVFYETLQEECPDIWALNDLFLKLWNPTTLSHDWILPDNFHVRCPVKNQEKQLFTLFGNRYSVTKEVNAPNSYGKSLGANVIHSIDGMLVREMTRRCMHDASHIDYLYNLIKLGKSSEKSNSPEIETLWNHYKKSGFLSSRILDYLNESNLHQVDADVILEMIESMPSQPFEILCIHDAFRVLPSHANEMRKQYVHLLAMITKSNLLQFLLKQLNTGVSVSLGEEHLWQDVLNSEYALS